MVIYSLVVVRGGEKEFVLSLVIFHCKASGDLIGAYSLGFECVIQRVPDFIFLFCG